MSEEKKAGFRQKQKENYAKLSKEQKEAFHKQGMDSVRKAGKVGSKLEIYLSENLTEAGYPCIMHVTQALMNEDLHLDIFIPSKKLVIEVDGPFHYKKIWDDRVLNSKQKSDQQKDYLVLGSGLSMIRVKTGKRFSPYHGRMILEKLISQIESLEKTPKVYYVEEA